MKTGDHILQLESVPGGAFDAVCTCRKWAGCLFTSRQEAREAHDQHFVDVAEKQQKAGVA